MYVDECLVALRPLVACVSECINVLECIGMVEYECCRTACIGYSRETEIEIERVADFCFESLSCFELSALSMS